MGARRDEKAENELNCGGGERGGWGDADISKAGARRDIDDYEAC